MLPLELFDPADERQAEVLWLLLRRERDVVAFADDAEREGIVATPTVIVRRDDGTEVFRAAGAPPLDAVLRALALAV